MCSPEIQGSNLGGGTEGRLMLGRGAQVVTELLEAYGDDDQSIEKAKSGSKPRPNPHESPCRSCR